MDPMQRIEQALSAALTGTELPGGPPRLAAAVRHAVIPGGARVRPRLCVAVALACGDDDPALTDATAAALELLHCASLVHDDLPCFDDSPLRRGVPSVHSAFGERLAVLAGDALIVLAFQLLAPGGVLLTYSCSGLMEQSLFQKIVADAALDAGREAQILERMTQAADHPIAAPYPEGYYLKGLVVRAI